MAAVWLDPGHGGPDPGTVTADRRQEADSNLRIARILAPMLVAAGHAVALSRETRLENPSLSERARRARDWGAELLISLHADSASSPEACGHHAIHSVRDKPGEGGNALAWLLVEHIADATGRPPFARDGGPVWSKRGTLARWQDYYGILRFAVQCGIEAPVIVERGFLTNPQEARLLFDDDFLRKQAEGIVAAVNEYAAVR